MDGQIGTWTNFLSVFRFLLSVRLQQFILIYMMLLSEGKMGVVWEPSKSFTISEIGEHWIQKYFRFCFVYTIRTAQFADARCPLNVGNVAA